MPPATCSRLCSWDSAWAGVFVRSAGSSVIVSAGYHLLLALLFFLFSVKPFTFIRFNLVMNIQGTNISPCETPVTLLKKLVLPSGKETISFVFL